MLGNLATQCEDGSPSPYSPSEVPQTLISPSSNHDQLEDENDDDDIDDTIAKRPIGNINDKESRKTCKAVVDTWNFSDLLSAC